MSDDEGPKSALELAMEKLRESGDFKETSLTDEQKGQIAEVRSLYRAKIAEFEIQQESKMTQIATADELDVLKEELTREKGRLSEEMERRVQAIRSGG